MLLMYAERGLYRMAQYDSIRPLKVAFYSPSPPDGGDSSGIVTYVRIMRDALRALGHEVMVVTDDQAETFAGETVRFTPVNPLAYRFRAAFKPAGDGSHPWSKLKIIDAHRYAIACGAEIFEIEESFGFSRYLDGPVVTRLHGPAVLSGEGGEDRKGAELRALTRFVTCPSERLLDAMALDAELAQAIPNPVEPAAKQWEYHGQTQMICVGRNDRRKGADIVLEAFARARAVNRALTLLMVGPGFDAAPSQEGVGFLGPQSASRLLELRLQSSLAIVGSRFECFPYSIAEAMALGMPVLASDTYGNAELIRDGIDGLIVPVGDVGAMASAMLSLTPERLKQMGASGRLRAREWLAPERIASETVSFYRSVLAYERNGIPLMSTP